MRAQSWVPGAALQAPVQPSALQVLQGCSQLPFDPSLSVAPDRPEASTPSGLDIEVKVPQETTLSAGGLSEADIQKTTMALPPKACRPTQAPPTGWKPAGPPRRASPAWTPTPAKR